jgi:hypothetical protein
LKRTSPLPNIIKPSANFTSSENSNSEKNQRPNEYVSLHRHFINNGKRTFIWLDLNNLGKILIKVLSKIDLSSPIDKSDRQDSTIFLSGNHKIGYFTIDATFMPVTRVI